MIKVSYDCLMDNARTTDDKEHCSEFFDNQEDAMQFIGMCKEGCMGIIDWGSFIVENNKSNKTYEIDFSLKEK